MTARLADLVAADDPPVALWGSLHRPQLGGAEDRMRERQYDREHAALVRWGRNLGAALRTFAESKDAPLASVERTPPPPMIGCDCGAVVILGANGGLCCCGLAW